MDDQPVSFTDWLTDALPVSEVPDKKYRHRRLDENPDLRQQILPRLKEAVSGSLEDMRRALEGPLKGSLDKSPPKNRPVTLAELYPQELPTRTKMGYFGEFFAGVLCEYFEAFGESQWEVPAYLFRYHYQVTGYLIRVKTNTAPQEVYNRQGDDCLAFYRDANGRIVKFVVCEAKCYQRHYDKAIQDAHRKLSKPGEIAEDRIQVIKILEERQKDTPDPQEQEWIDALYDMEYSEGTPDCTRYDLVCYVCGQAPLVGNLSWINRDRHSDDYKGGRRLEAVEIHINSVRDLVLELYGKSKSEKPDNESSQSS